MEGLSGIAGWSATDVWIVGFAGTILRWNGSAWSRTSVARLLPAAQKSHLNDPAVTGVFEQSADSVYATGNGNQQDDGGPVVLLHWNGRQRSKGGRRPVRLRRPAGAADRFRRPRRPVDPDAGTLLEYES